MKRLIVAAVAAIALMLGVAPAEATVPGQLIHLQHGSCDVVVDFGTYGTNGYARMDENFGSYCHPQSYIEVWVVNRGFVQSGPQCKFAYRFGNPFPQNCSYSGLIAMSIAQGEAIGLHARLCVTETSCIVSNINRWDGL